MRGLGISFVCLILAAAACSKAPEQRTYTMQGQVQSLARVQPVAIDGRADEDSPQAEVGAGRRKPGDRVAYRHGPQPTAAEQVEGGGHGAAAVAVADQGHGAAGRQGLDDPRQVVAGDERTPLLLGQVEGVESEDPLPRPIEADDDRAELVDRRHALGQATPKSITPRMFLPSRMSW